MQITYQYPPTQCYGGQALLHCVAAGKPSFTVLRWASPPSLCYGGQAELGKDILQQIIGSDLRGDLS